MEAYAKQVHDYLELMNTSALLIGEHDRANIDILITMLGEVDKDIINRYFGLFGTARQPLEHIAQQYKVAPHVITEIIEKDLRKMAITPEWQMMIRQFAPAVRQRLGM